jgi:hypothetical protein
MLVRIHAPDEVVSTVSRGARRCSSNGFWRPRTWPCHGRPNGSAGFRSSRSRPRRMRCNPRAGFHHRCRRSGCGRRWPLKLTQRCQRPTSQQSAAEPSAAGIAERAAAARTRASSSTATSSGDVGRAASASAQRDRSAAAEESRVVRGCAAGYEAEQQNRRTREVLAGRPTCSGHPVSWARPSPCRSAIGLTLCSEHSKNARDSWTKL